MFNVGDKVHIFNPKTSSSSWKENDGTVVQILVSHAPFTNKEMKVHIIRLANGQESPVEEKYLTKID